MKIIICAPGREYSGNFLMAWTTFIGQIILNRIDVHLSQEYSPNIYYVRNLCLGGDIRRGRNQLPFDGKIEYDYILWVDSDNIPNYENLIKLINRNVDICAAIYKMHNGQYATVKEWDTTKLIENGMMDFCEDKDFENKQDLIEVAYTGMGFCLIKKGVFEKLGYPWFKPSPIEIGNVSDFTTEDVYFCQQAQQLGYKVFIDPTCRAGHEKKFII